MCIFNNISSKKYHQPLNSKFNRICHKMLRVAHCRCSYAVIGKVCPLLSCHQFDPPQIARGRPSPRTPCARCRARSSCASWAARRRPSPPSRRSASTSAGARSSGPSSSSSARTAPTSSSGRARTWCPAATPPRATAAPTRAAAATRTCARAPRTSRSVTTRPCPRRGGSSPTTAKVSSPLVYHKVTNRPRVQMSPSRRPLPGGG